MVWVVLAMGVLVLGTTVLVRRGRLRVRPCCPEPSRDLRMRAAFEVDARPTDDR